MMSSDSLVLALGSNLSDRAGWIARAERLLEEEFGPMAYRSETKETQAIGFDGPPFLNAIAVFHCSMEPLDALAVCKRIERTLGRNDSAEYDSFGNRKYHDRIIDIDILFYGDRKLCTRELVIPHPAVNSRPFINELLLTLRPL